MADSDLPISGSPSSSSNKRRFDAMGPDGDVELPTVSTVQNAGTSSSTVSSTRSSGVEARRERNKRARNDMSDSSYASEVDDLLTATVHSVSPSSSDSSQSSYHSAHSVIPTLQPSSLVESTEDEDDMLLDPVIPEPSASSTPPPPPSFLENIPSLLTQSRSSPRPLSAADLRESRPSTATADEFARSVERAVAFDRAIAPLRRSPAVRPASPSGSAGPLPSLHSIDDFAIGLEIESFIASAQPIDVHSHRGGLLPRTSPLIRPPSSSSSRGAGALPSLRIPDDSGFDLASLVTSPTRPSGSPDDRQARVHYLRSGPPTRLTSRLCLHKLVTQISISVSDQSKKKRSAYRDLSSGWDAMWTIKLPFITQDLLERILEDKHAAQKLT
ncbi:hypothetical protein FKP32DRAFT_1674141 [Trametes sanguinea]|nr:hypothetical protein FKP32DRAFT_1674141 [Trametes sanguinea]